MTPPDNDPTPTATVTRRRGLGRGLDALLPSLTASSSGPNDAGGLVELDPDTIANNPEQPRRDFDGDALEALADSIRIHGLLQPIIVEQTATGSYQLVAGERRLRASRLAGISSVPAVVRPAAESARHALELALTENLLRADLSALEEATAYSRLADTFGLSHEAIALRIGRSRAAVSNTIRLLALSAAVQAALSEGRLTAGHARVLLSLPLAADQEKMAEIIQRDGLSVRQTERAVQAILDKVGETPTTSDQPAPRLGADDEALLRGFETALGAPVQLQRRRRGGKLVVEFHNDEDLGTLYAKIGGKPL